MPSSPLTRTNDPRNRRHQLIAGVVALVAIALVFLLVRPGSGPEDDGPPASADSTSSSEDSPSSSPSSASSSSTSSSSPSSTSRTLPDYTTTGRYARMPKGTPVRGTKGELVTYRVEVEKGSGVNVRSFAGAVDRTLSHPRGWTADGGFRFQRVTDEEPRVTIRLATPESVDKACAEAGVDTEGFLSCRAGNVIHLNLNRWAVGVKAVRDLGTYRHYLVNHEVGHVLGRQHEACPRKGTPAPVMQQQTKDLKGCTANAWPFDADGDEWTGPPTP